MKHFETVLEIHGLEGFEPDAPLTADNYREFVGWYSIKEEKLQCCHERSSGHLCRMKHNTGWVAKRKDGVHTIVGQVCAKAKFAADARIMSDIRSANNAISQLALEKRWKALLDAREDSLAKLDRAAQTIREAGDLVATWLDRIPEKARRQLVALTRMGDTALFAEGFTTAKRDKNGDVISPGISDVRVRLPRINGLEALPTYSRSGAFSIGPIRASLERIKEASPQRIGSVEKKLLSDVSKIDDIVAQADAYRRAAGQLEEADCTALCFLTDSQSEQIGLARLVLRKDGAPPSRDTCKRWLATVRTELCGVYGVKDLRAQR